MRRSTFIPLIEVFGLALPGAIPQRCQDPAADHRLWLEASRSLDNPLLHPTSAPESTNGSNIYPDNRWQHPWIGIEAAAPLSTAYNTTTGLPSGCTGSKTDFD